MCQLLNLYPKKKLRNLFLCYYCRTILATKNKKDLDQSYSLTCQFVNLSSKIDNEFSIFVKWKAREIRIP